MKLLPVILSFLLLAVSCDKQSPEEDGSPEEPDKLVETIALDGFILMSGGLNGPALYLFDTNSGTTSVEYPIDMGGGAFAVSPDGRFVAYRTSGVFDAPRDLVLTEVVREGGKPALRVVKTWEDRRISGLSWTPDGDRINTGFHLLDPASDDVVGCTDGTSQIIALAGRRYVCPGSDQLLEDGVPLAEVESDGHERTADDQFFDVRTHIPTAVTREEPYEYAFDTSYRDLVRAPLTDGTFGTYPRGPHGVIIVSVAAGFVTLYKSVTVTDLPTDGRRYDIAASFQTNTWTKLEALPFSAALTPWFTDGVGRYYEVAAVTGDGRAIYEVSSHITQDDTTQGTNFMSELPVEGALVEISPDGTSRGFRTSELRTPFIQVGSNAQSPTVTNRVLVELADGDWLIPAEPATFDTQTGHSPSWIGYFDDKPTYLPEVGDITSDGLTFIAIRRANAAGLPHTLCLRDVARVAETRCMSATPAFSSPVDIVGRGLAGPSADAAPMIRGLSRRAAWPEAAVVIHGAHFGTGGIVKVGDLAVPAAAITSWSDHRIDFVMDTSLPKLGRVTVETDNGRSTGRVFWLGKTALVPTPFDGVKTEVTRLGQGFNIVDLGALTDFEPHPDPRVTLDDDLRSTDGDFIIVSGGAAEPTLYPLQLQIGPYSRIVNFRLESGMADDNHWQFAISTGSDKPAFASIAGDLVQIGGGGFVDVGPPILEVSPQQRIPNTVAALYGLPDFWREGDDGAWIVNHTTNFGGTMKLLQSWLRPEDNAWGHPQFASGIGYDGNYVKGVDAAGETVLVVGGDLNNEHGVYALSNDGGKTFGAPVVVADTEQIFAEPIRVDAPTPYFIVFETAWGGGEVVGVHRIDTDGTLTPDVTSAPTGLQVSGSILNMPKRPFQVARAGERVLVFAPSSNTLADVDLGVASPTWRTLPSEADAGRVAAMHHDVERGELVVLYPDGNAMRATDASGWTDWAAYDFGFDFPVATRTVPRALARLGDGRWILLADLFDGRPGAAPNTRSPIVPGSGSAWIIGPTAR